jgi:hypothetical protein
VAAFAQTNWFQTLKSGAWLTPERMRNYAVILIAAYAVTIGVLLATAHHGLDVMGRPLGTDFKCFWSASKLALTGRASDAYDLMAHRQAQVAITGRDTGYAAFFYPPIFLLVCLPLALAPYLPSLAAWLTLTGAAYAATARAWLGKQLGWLPVFAFPAVLTNVAHGQNAFLSAALFGSGALWLERRPVLAGVCLGALVYKPHLGLVIPVALAIGGRWRCFVAAGATVVALTAASLAVFGPDCWRAFLANAGFTRMALEQGLIGDGKVQSAFAAVRLWGGAVPLAYSAQALVAAVAVAGLLWLHRRSPHGPAEGPAMIVAALLISPFLLDYDLVILALPLAWLLREGARSSFCNWEKPILAIAFVLPAVSRSLAMTAHLPLSPFVLAALFALIVRRGAGTEHQSAPARGLAALGG